MAKTPRILSIAGSDSGGGAGIQADIKTITMMGGHAMTAVTAITAQNTLGVDAIHMVPVDIVMAQIDAAIRDIGVDAIKIGMVGGADTSHAVADRLEDMEVPVIFDPVMIATSGSPLADEVTIAAFGRLMDIASVVTPNIPELEALGGRGVILDHDCHLVTKGGHGEGVEIVDRLYSPQAMIAESKAPRIETRHTHGTGCTFASAMAYGLGAGHSMIASFEQAVSFVRTAIENAPQLGAGHGPLGHQSVKDICS